MRLRGRGRSSPRLKAVIVTAETIVERLTANGSDGHVQRNKRQTTVAHAPFGAHPPVRGHLRAGQGAHGAIVIAAHGDTSFAEYLRTQCWT